MPPLLPPPLHDADSCSYVVCPGFTKIANSLSQELYCNKHRHVVLIFIYFPYWFQNCNNWEFLNLFLLLLMVDVCCWWSSLLCSRCPWMEFTSSRNKNTYICISIQEKIQNLFIKMFFHFLFHLLFLSCCLYTQRCFPANCVLRTL